MMKVDLATSLRRQEAAGGGKWAENENTWHTIMHWTWEPQQQKQPWDNKTWPLAYCLLRDGCQQNDTTPPQSSRRAVHLLPFSCFSSWRWQSSWKEFPKAICVGECGKWQFHNALDLLEKYWIIILSLQGWQTGGTWLNFIIVLGDFKLICEWTWAYNLMFIWLWDCGGGYQP